MATEESAAGIPPLLVPAPAAKTRAPTLYLIILMKLAKGMFLLLLAFGVYQLAGSDLQGDFLRMVRQVNIDPENQIFAEVGKSLESITPGNVRAVATGALLYSLFSFVEGTGLFLRVGWAGWMAIGESAFFIPIELYEMLRSYSTTILVILLLNAWMVYYLYTNRLRLFKHHHHH